MHAVVSSIVTVVHRHLKGPLWKEAVDLLKLAVSNSAALVQPPTRGLPVVDLGLFNQTLPGPTLQFSMDLQVMYCTCDTYSLNNCNSAMQGEEKEVETEYTCFLHISVTSGVYPDFSRAYIISIPLHILDRI